MGNRKTLIDEGQPKHWPIGKRQMNIQLSTKQHTENETQNNRNHTKNLVELDAEG